MGARMEPEIGSSRVEHCIAGRITHEHNSGAQKISGHGFNMKTRVLNSKKLISNLF
jgi:hypothetical protein